MNIVSAPIVATTSLSVLLHGAVVVALLAANGQSSPNEAVGQGLEIELISSITTSNQRETDVPRRQQATVRKNIESVVSEKKSKTSQAEVVTLLRSDKAFIAVDSDVDDFDVQQHDDESFEDEQIIQSSYENDSNAAVLQSTNASQKRHSILELLHSRISDNKKYPYMAQRQRREGITKIAFVLHPDGTIKNTRLINSSQTAVLDRAAISAVKGIEPFLIAQEYIDQAEEFQVDVVFDLL